MPSKCLGVLFESRIKTVTSWKLKCVKCIFVVWGQFDRLEIVDRAASLFCSH